MKKLQQTLVFVGCLMALNFSSQAQESAIFIYKDISGSVGLNEDQTQQEKDYLKKYLFPRLDQDIIHINAGFLFASSSSVLNNKSFSYEPTASKGENQRNKFTVITKVIQTVHSSTSRSNQTEILATLKPILNQASKHQKLEVLWLSDMLESSTTRELILYSLKDAEEKGIADAKKIAEIYSLQKNTDTQAEFLCLLPLSQTNEKREFQYIEQYWSTVLSHFFENFTLKFELL